jgi:transcriptional regulator with XRE-family HTH domain
MKKEYSISSLFGLTQREMATLLGVGYSQWSMFEAGKRSLPSQAQLRLNEMLSHIQTAQNTTKKIQPKASDDEQVRTHIKRLLKENEYQRLISERKLAAAERNMTNEARRSELAAFLKIKKQGDQSRESLPAKVIANKIEKTEKSRIQLTAFDLRLKLELLAFEKKYLESKLESFGKL